MTLLLALACAHAPPAEEPPPAIERAEIHWFDLQGVDRIDLLESCLANCPRDESGTTVASLATWEVRWAYTRPPVEPCAVASASVDAMVSVELPRWEAPPEADPELVAEWEAWHARLRYHEQGHVDVVHAYAQDAEARLVEAGCDGVEAAGAALTEGVRRSQFDYDLATGNGHSQGASFWRTNGRDR